MIVGGTNINKDLKGFKEGPPDILIATPVCVPYRYVYIYRCMYRYVYIYRYTSG